MAKATQLQLEFEPKSPFLLTVDEIYEKQSVSLILELKEDRRLERKPPGFQIRELGDYISMFANTQPGGGIIIIGMENNGIISGCSSLGTNRINELERAGHIYCPDAQFDSKRLQARNVEGEEDFLLLIRVYFREDKLVYTVSGDAFYRLGESKEKYTPDQAREAEIDRGQLDLELEPCQYEFPQEFDAELIKLFATNFRRSRGLNEELSDAEILELRNLGRMTEGHFKPNKACAWLFAKNSTREFPGCKIRFLRFEGEVEGVGDRWNAIKDMVQD
jgi:ATP-dependent DNA helicase RecG